jgi:hypothetical protein
MHTPHVQRAYHRVTGSAYDVMAGMGVCIYIQTHTHTHVYNRYIDRYIIIKVEVEV